jgi:hypothetical protein
VPTGALVDVSAAIERSPALGGRRCCITVLVRFGRVSHGPAVVVFAARSGIEEQRGAVARLVATGYGNELVPHHRGNLRIAEAVPVVPDKLEAVVVATGQGAATVHDHALEMVLAEIPSHPPRGFRVVVKTHHWGESETLGLLVYRACTCVVFALGQADGQAGWQGREARAPPRRMSTIRCRPVEESVEEFLDGRLAVAAGRQGKHSQGKDVARGGLEVLVAPCPHQAPVPGPRRIVAKKVR